MEDIIQKYKKQQKIKNIAIIFTSLAFAFWIHTYLQGTSYHFITSNILGSKITTDSKSGDLEIISEENTWNMLVKIKSNKSIKQVTSLSFSVAYNDEWLDFKNKTPLLSSKELIEIGAQDGFITLMYNFPTPVDIALWEEIVWLTFEKKWSQSSGLNLLNANVTDVTWENYLLSTSSWN